MILISWCLFAISACGFSFAVGRLMPPQRAAEPLQAILAPQPAKTPPQDIVFPAAAFPALLPQSRAAADVVRDFQVQNRPIASAYYNMADSRPLCQRCRQRESSIARSGGWWCARCAEWIVRRPDTLQVGT